MRIGIAIRSPASCTDRNVKCAQWIQSNVRNKCEESGQFVCDRLHLWMNGMSAEIGYDERELVCVGVLVCMRFFPFRTRL